MLNRSIKSVKRKGVLKLKRKAGIKVNFSIRTKFLLGFISMICLFAASMYFVSIAEMNMLAIQEVKERLNSSSRISYELLDSMYPGEWKADNGNLYKGSKLINGDELFVDKVKEKTGAAATLFLGDTRIATNVADNNGKRAIGTKASANVVDTVYKSGIEFSGEANVQGSPYQANYTPIKDRDGKVIGMWFVGVDKGVVKNEISKMKTAIGIAALIVICLGIAAVELITRGILKNIKLALSSIRDMEEGKLHNKWDSKSNDEVGFIINSIDKLRSSLRDIIVSIRENSSQVMANSENLAAAAEDSVQSIKAVSKTTDELAAGASVQAQNAQEGVEKLMDLAEEIKSAVNSAEQVREYSNQTRNANENGIVSLNLLISKFKTNGELSKMAADSVEKLTGRSGSIEEIIGTIQSIAQQTNLLSLNASIEAARAGEHGKGFAVVADEIRKLSEQTTASAKQIEDIISDIQNEIKMVKKNMDDAGLAVIEANNAVEDTNKVFLNINNVINETVFQIDNLTGKINIVDENKDIVLKGIEEISAISQESAASTEEVSAAMGEQASAMNRIHQSTVELKTIVASLEGLIKKFSI